MPVMAKEYAIQLHNKMQKGIPPLNWALLGQTGLNSAQLGSITQVSERLKWVVEFGVCFPASDDFWSHLSVDTGCSHSADSSSNLFHADLPCHVNRDQKLDKTKTKGSYAQMPIKTSGCSLSTGIFKLATTGLKQVKCTLLISEKKWMYLRLNGGQMVPDRECVGLKYLPTVWLASCFIRLNCFFIFGVSPVEPPRITLQTRPLVCHEVRKAPAPCCTFPSCRCDREKPKPNKNSP